MQCHRDVACQFTVQNKRMQSSRNACVRLVKVTPCPLIRKTFGKVFLSKRQTPDGSTYEVQFQGQFLNATDAVGTYTTNKGTGRFAGTTGKGRWASQRWTDGLGSRSIIEGEMTKSR